MPFNLMRRTLACLLTMFSRRLLDGQQPLAQPPRGGALRGVLEGITELALRVGGSEVWNFSSLDGGDSPHSDGS